MKFLGIYYNNRILSNEILRHITMTEFYQMKFLGIYYNNRILSNEILRHILQQQNFIK